MVCHLVSMNTGHHLVAFLLSIHETSFNKQQSCIQFICCRHFKTGNLTLWLPMIACFCESNSGNVSLCNYYCNIVMSSYTFVSIVSKIAAFPRLCQIFRNTQTLKFSYSSSIMQSSKYISCYLITFQLYFSKGFATIKIFSRCLTIQEGMLFNKHGVLHGGATHLELFVSS